MKKTLTLLIVLSALCTILAACSPAAPALDGGSASLAPAASPTPTASPAPAATPGPVELRKGVEAMMPILDSILNTMGMTDTTPYAPKDADFFWSVLYLTGVNWGHTHPLIEYNNVHAIIPSQVMQEFASAAFRDYDDLLPLPQSFEDAMQYDDGLDAYLLALSDRGDSSTTLDSVEANADGSVTALVSLHIAPDAFWGTMEFNLAANPYAEAISEPTYLYTVQDAKLVKAPG